MKIFDAHCDVLLKLWENPDLDFRDDRVLHTNYTSMRQVGEKNIQCFAIYIPEYVHEQMRFQVALEMIDIFYTKVIVLPGVKMIASKSDFVTLQKGEIGAILTLEGCDAIGSDPIKLKTLLRLGVRSIGLTWNYANAVADGVLETRAAGLSDFGKTVVKMNNRYNICTDVSHLAERGFWDVMAIADAPFASHSNAKAVADHPRNLTDEQIRALIAKDAVIGVTFVPEFVTSTGAATIDQLLKHIDHICSLGGSRNIGFGSDFDGIDETLDDLQNYSDYGTLIDALVKRYPEQLVRGFLHDNFFRMFTAN